MQWAILTGLTFVLMGIAWEDFKCRQVHLLWFVAIGVLCFVFALQFETWKNIFINCVFNLGFLLLQGVMLVGYFVMKHKRWINITNHYIGWGDVVFLLLIIPLFDPLTYLLFYLVSLSLTIIGVLVFQWLIRSSENIPLAGIQSLLLLLVLYWNQCGTPILLNGAIDHWLFYNI